MKKNLIYIFAFVIFLSSCVIENGKDNKIYRVPNGKEYITLYESLLYASADKDVLYKKGTKNFEFHTKINDINTDSIEILQVGLCWKYDNGNGDTIPYVPKINSELEGAILQEVTDNLLFEDSIVFKVNEYVGYDSVYHVRSFIIAKDLRWERIDTGYNQIIARVRTRIPENFWIRKGNYSGGNREDATSFVLDNEAYVFGGFDGLNIYNDTWKYDPETDTWEQKGSSGVSPQGRKGAVAFVVDGNAWVGLGVTESTTNKVDSTFIYYTASTNSWRKKYAEFPSSRQNSIAFSLQVGEKQRGFVGFGMNSNGIETGDLYMYLQEADTAGTILAWAQVPVSGNTPLERTGACVTVIENRAFMFGGSDDGEYYNDFWMFDAVSNYPNGTWTKIQEDFPGDARANAVSFSLEYERNDVDYKVVYVGTGISSNGLLNDFYKYDLANQYWSEISFLGGPGDFGEPREGAVAFDIIKNHDEYGLGVLNRGFVIGGRTDENAAVKEVWEYFP